VLAARDDADSVEGFGLVLLEAAACGRAVVATRAGGIEDAVRDGHTGLLVAQAATESLIEALARVLLDDELRARLAAGGRQHATENATWERAAEQIYEALLR
jgi:glycosyltransferase involved in cell wall biosynthesis